VSSAVRQRGEPRGLGVVLRTFGPLDITFNDSIGELISVVHSRSTAAAAIPQASLPPFPARLPPP